MKNIFETLKEIKKRPELYIGSRNLTFLYHFINGYLLRSNDLDDKESFKIRELHFWLPNKTGIEIENWLENLLTKAKFDEEIALDLFFKYLEEFILEIDYCI